MKIFFASTFFMLLFFASAKSQNSNIKKENSKTRILSYQELLDEMVNCKDSIYELKNATIQYDIKKDKRFLIYSDSVAIKQLDTLRVKASIKIKNSSFNNFPINSDPSMFTNLCFSKVEFGNEVSIINCKIQNSLIFQHCKFNLKLTIRVDESTDKEVLYIDKTNFSDEVDIRFISGSFYFSDSNFDLVNKKNKDEIAWFFSNESQKGGIQFGRCNFIKKDSLNSIQFNVPNIRTVRFFNNKIDSDIRFSEMSIEDITMRENKFLGLVDMTNTDFGYVKTELTFDQLSNHIGVYSNEDDFKGLWYPKNLNAFKDTIASERFFSVYRNLTEYFKNRGNIKEYNACYTEMKGFETLQLHYYYNKYPSLDSWFSWRMNQFLGIFSNYGTKPVKAIIYAIKVIFVFALFFFFFHNDWDTFTKKTLMDRMKLLSAYYRSQDGIASLYEAQEKSKYENYDEFIKYMDEGKNEIPKMFHWISKPLFQLSTFKIHATTKFLNKTEILNGRWIELEGKKKAASAFWGGFILLFYLTISLFMKVLNAIMLSINSFTTLGFGEIPTRGIGRYAAIIEGFIGWFILTLFSVSLITQLLQ